MMFTKTLLLSLVTVSLFGCASVGVKKSDYFSRLGSVELGVSKSEFRTLFPESIPRGAKMYPNGTISEDRHRGCDTCRHSFDPALKQRVIGHHLV